MRKIVFISYADEDSLFVRKIQSQLQAYGLDVWNFKSSVKGGQRWKEMEQVGLNSSEYIIVIVSESVVNDKERKREVWYEIKYALKEAEKLPGNLCYIIPVLIHPVDIPAELSDYQVINFKDQGIQGILQVIDHKPIAAKTFLENFWFQFILLLGLIISVSEYFSKKQHDGQSPTLQSKAYKFIVQTDSSLQGENRPIVTVVSGNNDTVTLTNQSQEQGVFILFLDSIYRPFVVIFTQPGYETVRLTDKEIKPDNWVLMKRQTLQESEEQLMRKTIQTTGNTYSLSGFDLSPAQKKQIEKSCGYQFSHSSDLVFTFTYDKSKIVCFDGACRFEGDIPLLIGSGLKKYIGDSIPPSPDKQLSRREVEDLNEKFLDDIKRRHQYKLYESVFHFLCGDQ